jgi:hypothetical protein
MCWNTLVLVNKFRKTTQLVTDCTHSRLVQFVIGVTKQAYHGQINEFPNLSGPLSACRLDLPLLNAELGADRS